MRNIASARVLQLVNLRHHRITQRRVVYRLLHHMPRQQIQRRLQQGHLEYLPLARLRPVIQRRRHPIAATSAEARSASARSG